MTTPFSIDSPEFRELLQQYQFGFRSMAVILTYINAKIAEAVKAERDEWIAQLKLLEKKP